MLRVKARARIKVWQHLRLTKARVRTKAEKARAKARAEKAKAKARKVMVLKPLVINATPAANTDIGPQSVPTRHKGLALPRRGAFSSRDSVAYSPTPV